MNKSVQLMAVLAVAQLLATCLPAQEVAPRGPFAGGAQGERQRVVANRRAGGEVRAGEGFGGEAMLFRMVMDPRLSAEIGLTPDAAASLRADMTKVQEKQIDLQAELSKLMLRQTDQAAGLLANRAKAPDEAFKLVEEIGKVRTAIAKLAIERIVVVRKHMSDEQIAKARRTLSERLERRGGEGRPRRGGEGEVPGVVRGEGGDVGGARGERGDRAERGNRVERGERGNRGERVERGDRAERGERGDRADRAERGERGDRE
jgi:hypothetical protein